MDIVPRKAFAGPRRDFVGYGRKPPDIRWPGGAAVAVNLVLNYEEGAEYSQLDGDPINDTWGEYSREIPPPLRDIATETHMEFGSRVGVWRIVRILDEFDVPCSIDAPAVALERNPDFCAWIRERNHDVIGHGYRWTEDSQMTREEEREYLRLAIESIQRTTGQRIRGWIVRSMPSVNTRELLVEEGGFLYDSDASNDELPYYADVKGERFLVLPYSKVYNDVRYLIAPTYATPNDFFENLRLALDYMVDECARGYAGRMMSVGLHARWSGQANRASAVRDFVQYVQAKHGACFMRRVDIAEHWLATYPDLAPAG